jgi:sulfate adenylyltransferase subunit 1
LVPAGETPEMTEKLDIILCWFNEIPARKKNSYLLRKNSEETVCYITQIHHKMNIQEGFGSIQYPETIDSNEIGLVSVRTGKPVLGDSYKTHPQTGCLILIDVLTIDTVAAGMIQ